MQIILHPNIYQSQVLQSCYHFPAPISLLLLTAFQILIEDISITRSDVRGVVFLDLDDQEAAAFSEAVDESVKGSLKCCGVILSGEGEKVDCELENGKHSGTIKS